MIHFIKTDRKWNLTKLEKASSGPHNAVVNGMGRKPFQFFLLIFRKASPVKGITDFFHQMIVIPEVVNYTQPHAEHLAAL